MTPSRKFRVNPEPLATDVKVTDDAISVVLADGRELSIPLEWSPRLKDASPKQRKKWILLGGGLGIHWNEIFASLR